jgi:putative glutathione S-transferase
VTAGRAPRQVRITPATALRAAVTALGAVAVLVVLRRSHDVIEWLVTAAVIAVLLNGPVHALAGRVHRGLAVAAISIVTLAVLAGVAFGVADAALDQYRILRTAAPAAAAGLEQSPRFTDLAVRVRLVERTRDAVEAIPSALFGPPASVAQTAAQRLGAFLLVATLAVFMLATYDRFVRWFLQLNVTAQHRWRWSAAVGPGAYRGVRAARHAFGRAALLGFATAVVAELVGLPAPVVLGLWMALWRLLPLLGIVVGYTPLVLLLVAEHPASVTTLALTALGASELVALLVERKAFRRPVGGLPIAFVSAAALAAGFEFAGVVGAVVALVIAHIAVGILESIASLSRASPPTSPVTSSRTSSLAPVGRYAGPVDYDTYGPYGPGRGFDRGRGFQRPRYPFQGRITADGSSGYLAEPDRYHLYIAYGCPWAQRTAIVRRLAGLEGAVSLSYVDDERDGRGWAFREPRGPDPVNGFAFLAEAYEATEPGYGGHISVPVLWDRHTGKIVSNNYPDITIDLGTQFGAWADAGVDLYPDAMRADIDALNERVYEAVNDGPYRVAGALTQDEYEGLRQRMIAALDELEERLAGGRFLFGDRITEADVRLWPTLARFDLMYNPLARISARPLADYPQLWGYARDLYQRPAFRETTDFASFSAISRGPAPTFVNHGPVRIAVEPHLADWEAPHGRERLG